MSIFKYHAFIYFMRPPPWYGTGRFASTDIFVEKDVLYPWMFCIYGRFVGWTFCRGGRFVSMDVLYLWTFWRKDVWYRRTLRGRTFCGRMFHWRSFYGRLFCTIAPLNGQWHEIFVHMDLFPTDEHIWSHCHL